MRLARFWFRIAYTFRLKPEAITLVPVPRDLLEPRRCFQTFVVFSVPKMSVTSKGYNEFIMEDVSRKATVDQKTETSMSRDEAELARFGKKQQLRVRRPCSPNF